MRQRLRDYGLIPGRLQPGTLNLISDVPGVTVGHLTKIEGQDTRTGVTVIDPLANNIFRSPRAAALAVGNGFGKFAGATQIIERGTIETPIALTGTHSVGPAMRGLIELTTSRTPDLQPYESINAVVGETNDWILNDLHGPPITPDDVRRAWDAKTRQFELGSVGAGTGPRAFSWKGGIGSASRQVSFGGTTVTIGALVQTNYGGDLTIMGVPVGRLLGAGSSMTFGGPVPDGSCIIVLVTDAALTSRQLGRIARRGPLALARTGSVMADSSGDYSLAFSTADPAAASELSDGAGFNLLFLAAIEAVEESLYDALFTATTVTGRDGNTLEEFPAQTAATIIKKYTTYEAL